jgi:SEC-C motif-containing protein
VTSCACGNPAGQDSCCGPYLAGTATPPTPEVLVRSRFSAFRTGNVAHLLRTWHPSRRPAALSLEGGPRWLALRILAAPAPQEERGEVEFCAYHEGTPVGQLHERSRFVREDGIWLYVDGTILPALPLDRNGPCFCGSGRKLKKCCG